LEETNIQSHPPPPPPPPPGPQLSMACFLPGCTHNDPASLPVTSLAQTASALVAWWPHHSTTRTAPRRSTRERAQHHQLRPRQTSSWPLRVCPASLKRIRTKKKKKKNTATFIPDPAFIPSKGDSTEHCRLTLKGPGCVLQPCRGMADGHLPRELPPPRQKESNSSAGHHPSGSLACPRLAQRQRPHRNICITPRTCNLQAN